MFNKKTVFILGAGASWHYGYPTGEELVRRVKEKADALLKTYMPLVEDFRAPSFFPDKFKYNEFELFVGTVKEVKGRLSEANPLVIDDFLGRNQGIADVGKLLIAMVLLECEKQAIIRSGKFDEKTKEDTGNGDWVRYIVQHLTIDCERPEDLLANQVTFVSFNYDHSLEQRLYAALKNYQSFADRGHSDEFFSPGRIFHVYGQLRDFETIASSETRDSFGGEHRKLAIEINRAWDASLAQDQHGKPRIRTIAPEEKVAASEIVEAIADAKYLYFLGYGFDSRNNELLGLGVRPAGSPRQYIRFTNFGNYNKVSKQVGRTFHMHETSLIGERYIADTEFDDIANRYVCEKSTKSVYDALAQDFDWPE